MAFRAPVFAVLLFAASSPGQAATGAEDSPIASTSEPLQQETGGSSLAEELELLLAGCAFCDPSPPPPAAPAPSRKALLCKGHLDETGSVCCTAGCGQSRVQCAETADVCSGSRRGDLTTKANCVRAAPRSGHAHLAHTTPKPPSLPPSFSTRHTPSQPVPASLIVVRMARRGAVSLHYPTCRQTVSAQAWRLCALRAPGLRPAFLAARRTTTPAGAQHAPGSQKASCQTRRGPLPPTPVLALAL